MPGQVTVVRPHERSHLDTTPTPGMHREQAFYDGAAWVGVVHTAAGVTSGWHHHGDYDTYVYISSGRQLVESGPDGKEHTEANPGDVVHVGKHIIHRESNPGSEETLTFVVRVGSGPPVINVEGPERETRA